LPQDFLLAVLAVSPFQAVVAGAPMGRLSGLDGMSALLADETIVLVHE
jgi:hypothetical protein